MLRTHTCGELRANSVGKEVVLSGWVDQHRDFGQLFFIALRDRYGVTQCVFEGDDESLAQQVKELGLEYCISIKGVVRKRRDQDINKDVPTGELEVAIKKITVLNKSKVLPFSLHSKGTISDDLRFKYRYLDLRRPKMQSHLEIRNKIIQAARSALTDLGFLEIETPLFVRSTPEGARDFVVPSRVHAGKFYALPQSPQLYKQLLMISGCDRYFQFAAAFRDEDLRADRVPVHTQIDMEMSFVEEKDVFHAVETYLSRIFKEVKDITIPLPLPIMTYREAMERFGSDKPDVRFALELQTVTDLAQATDFPGFKEAATVRCITVPDAQSLSRKDLDAFAELAPKYRGCKFYFARLKDGAWTGGVAKFFANDCGKKLATATGAKEESVVLIVAGPYEEASKYLCALRLDMGKRFDLIDKSRLAFLWVNEFPLFEYDHDRGVYNAMHHHFCQPMAEDLQYLETKPEKVRGQLYDLVLNGVELLSGSIRINRPEIQEKVFEITGFSKEEAESKFGFLMEAFRFGAPPHGGSAMGLDRLTALLCEVDSIRDVIAFPCNNQGIFPLDGSPAPISEVQLHELSLSVTAQKTVKE
ncbi:MAG: aspartate--tRNA ligase [Oligoflexales bacterium]